MKLSGTYTCTLEENCSMQPTLVNYKPYLVTQHFVNVTGYIILLYTLNINY
jgi:hypothetical protein